MYIEIVQPIEIAQHKPRSKSRSSPFARIAVDSRGASFEATVGCKQAAIMFEIMYPHFEPTGSEVLPQFGWNPVTSFGDKVKGRTKSKIRFKLHQRSTPTQTFFGLDVMGQNKRKLFAFRPACPVLRWALRSWHDRPDITDAFAQSHCQPSSNRCPNGLWNERL